MASIVDDRGFNQGFKPNKALEVRTLRRVEAILSEMTFTSETRIVELGCGTGEMSWFLASRTPAMVIGVDICATFVSTAQERYTRGNLRFEQMDMLKDDVPCFFSDGVDYIVGNGILHHLRKGLPDVLLRLKRYLRPGGRLIFWEPNIVNPYVWLIFKVGIFRKWAKLEPDEMAFSRWELATCLKEAGYSDIKCRCRDFLLPNTPALLIDSIVKFDNSVGGWPFVSEFAQSVFISASIPGGF